MTHVSNSSLRSPRYYALTFFILVFAKKFQIPQPHPMTLFQALAKSEELNCRIVNRSAGVVTNAKTCHKDLEHSIDDWPKTGWELDDTPMPICFEAIYLGSGKVEGMTGDVTAFTFKGNHVSVMPMGTKMKVTLEPSE